MGSGSFKDARSFSFAALIFFIVAIAFLGFDFFGDDGWGWAMPAAIGTLAVGATLAWLGLRYVVQEGESDIEAEHARFEQAIAEERRRADAAIEEERARAEHEAAVVREERAQLEALERRNQDMELWASELRNRIQGLTHERGPFGSTADIPTMILRIAIELLGAEKGLLLSRSDEDRDGDLDLLAEDGFNNDPSDSAVAQRFARTVIQRDETIRENEPTHENATAADNEIENLVAIPIWVRDEFIGVVVVANKEGGFDEHEDEVLLALGDHAGALLQNSRLRGDLRASYLAMIRILADALEAKDPFLRRHLNDVSAYVTALARRLDLSERKREELVFASLLHDLGKIGISERILLKPASLSPEEYNIVKLHTRIGYRLVEQVPGLIGICAAVLHHHERWDGTGYPDGLRGEEIPLEARVVGVADAFSAMTSDRPYRGRMSLEQALEELERNAGTQFDPEIVRLFCEEMRARPPIEDRESELAIALSDPQLVIRLGDDEPVLGHGAHAVVDNLTLLYSHRYIHEMAEAEGERSAVQKTPFSVVMAQVANIDQINEQEGYAAGDAAIRRLAQAVQRLAVTCGGTAGRYSGSRIVLLMPRSGRDEAERCARELEASLKGAAETYVAVTEWLEDETGTATLLRARSALAAKSAAAST